MDSLTIALIVVAALLGIWVGVLVAKRFAPALIPVVEPSDAVLAELADLRHLKAQLETPPQHHDHIWPREPDLRKMGWLRYRCAYTGCPAVDWRPS